MKFQEIMTLIDQKAEEVRKLFDDADANHSGDMPADDMERVKSLNKEIEELEQRAADTKEGDDIRVKNQARLDAIRKPAGTMFFPAGGKEGAQVRAIKSLGQQFVESSEWRDYLKLISPGGTLSEKTRVQSPPFMVEGGLKTLITGVSDTGAGAFVVADQSGIYDPLGRRPLTIRDIISVRTTDSDLVEYVRQTSRVNAAAPVAEATATAGSSGTKPEGGMAFERVQTAVKTIAEWVPATKRALSDAGQMRGIIDDELRADLEEELEDQIMTGDGVGENFTGIDAVSGTQDQAWDTNALVTTRKARTLVLTVGRARPNAYVMNPTDWQTIDLLVDNENRYFFGGPSVLGTPRLWGLPVVESEAQPVGNAWVADFKRAVLWDREQAQISASDSHSDFFIRNLVAILGELRAAFGVIRPTAFVEIDLTA